MGWWRTGRGDDVIDDDGADIVLVAIERLGRGHSPRPDGRLTLEQILATAGAALALEPGELVDDPRQLGTGRLVAEMRDGTRIRDDGQNELGADAARLMRDALDDLAAN
jgi:hypothetical protein